MGTEGTPSPGQGWQPLLQDGSPFRFPLQLEEAAGLRSCAFLGGFPRDRRSRGGDAPEPTPAGRTSPVAECQVAGVTQPTPCWAAARQTAVHASCHTCTGTSVANEEEAAVGVT